MQRHLTAASGSAFAFTLLLSLLAPPLHAAIEEVVVTAQKREESLQDVPIAVSAFNADQLDRKQIDSFADLQFNVPNVSYTKGNFSGSNFSIRGLGTVAVGTSADSGVGVHINDVYLQSPRLFETEYYDIEQLEVLRGPQGTLFGRNATAGAINMKTARPVIGELTTDFEVQVGNYDHGKVKGAVNIPINDRMAARIAGIWLERDGYTDNVLTGDDIDDRSQRSIRVSLRIEPTDTTTIDIIAHTFDEDSSRTRSQKQFCDFDPSGVLGCLPTGRGKDALNPFATLGYLLPSTAVLPDALALFDPVADAASPAGNPSNLRKVSAFFDPEYEADEDFVMVEVKQVVNDWLDLTFIGAYQETTVVSQQDYNGTASGATVSLPPAFGLLFPDAARFLGTTAGGPAAVSTVSNIHRSMGLVSGDFVLSDTFSAQDTSTALSEQTSFELRFNSQLDGPFNFMLAGSTFDFKGETDYFVRAAGLDYFSLIGAAADAPAPAGSFTVLAPGYYNNETPRFDLESWAVFGEGYYDLTETLKLTVGLRYNVDEKYVRDRQLLLNVPVHVNADTGQVTTPWGTPVRTIDELIAAGAAAGLYDADPNRAGNQVFREADVEFKEWTGRIVLDWLPDVAFTDSTLVYASYSRGYKGGGINPAFNTELFPGTPAAFDPEKIHAYEIGTKNQLWDNRLQANLSAFYYDYKGLQVSKIVNRTSINENIDADIYGAEAEFLFAPNQNWLFNAAFSWLDTEIGEFESIDPRDPTQGRDDVTLIKDLQGAHCLLEHNGQGPASANAGLRAVLANPALAGIDADEIPYVPTGAETGIPATPGVTDSAFSSCQALQGLAPVFGYGYSDGVPTSIDGNPLPNSPEFTVSLGAEYTHYFGNGATLSARLDYYWQDEFSTRIFAREMDMVDAWDVWNAQATFTSPNGLWWVRAFVQNLENDTEITGLYSTDQTSGLFTNGFFIEPRLYGLTLGVRL